VVEIQHLDPGTLAARRPQQHGKKAQTAQELWTPVAVAAVGTEQTAGEEPAELRLLYQNAGGWRTTPKKRQALGQMVRGELAYSADAPTPTDLAAYAEVHCQTAEEARKWGAQVQPTGRSYFTYYLAVFAGPRLNGTDIVATQYADGRVLRLDCRLHGRDRSYLFVYVPDKAAERVPFLAGFPACMPAARDTVIMGFQKGVTCTLVFATPLSSSLNRRNRIHTRPRVAPLTI